MESKWKDWDGPVIGGILGLLIAVPTIATTMNGWLISIIPASWNWLGAYTIPILTVAVGMIIGYIVDRT